MSGNIKNENFEKGFTMVELVIVIAIMGIVGAMLVPHYFNLSNKARVTTDVSSIITIQNQMEVYIVEFNKSPGIVAEDIIKELVDVGYLKKFNINSDGKLSLQTSGAEVIYDKTIEEFRLKVPKKYYNLCKNTDNVKNWLIEIP